MSTATATPVVATPVIEATHPVEPYQIANDWFLVSEIKPEALEWLWEGRLPFRSIVAFAGDMAVAKTTMGIDLIARGSNGADFIDGVKNTVGVFHSILLSAEDDPSAVLVPRLIAAGADVTNAKIYLPKPVKVGKGKNASTRAMRLDSDLSTVVNLLTADPKIKLMVIDPMSNYIGDKDIMNEQKVRQVMMPIALMAQQFDVVIICIFHNGKSTGRTALQKVIGAVGNVGVCRAGWTFLKDPANENRKLMLQMKENYGKFDGLAFTTTGVPMMLPNHSGIEVQTMQPKIVYLGKSTEEANNLITTMEDPVEKTENVFVLALGKLCPCGSTRKATVVEADMEALGHTGSKNRYCNARKKLGILSEQKDDGYWWSRPEMEGDDDL